MLGGWEIDVRLAEAAGLAPAIGIDIRASQSFRVRSPRPATLFGRGQAQMIADLVQANAAELVIVDNRLSPLQQSNLEKAPKEKVIDRIGLILEIFGEQGAAAKARLPFELAP